MQPGERCVVHAGASGVGEKPLSSFAGRLGFRVLSPSGVMRSSTTADRWVLGRGTFEQTAPSKKRS